MPFAVRYAAWAMVALTVGCQSAPRPQPHTVASAPVATHPAASDPALGSHTPVRVTVVQIEPEVRRACGVDNTRAFFDAGSKRIHPRAHDTLDQIAACMTRGPLANKQLTLTGHADERSQAGQPNPGLALERAEAIAQYLQERGVDRGRLTTDSIREHQDPSWGWDRRVDLAVR